MADLIDREELKCCPHCGSEVGIEVYKERKGFGANIHCFHCMAEMTTVTCDTEDEALNDLINNWNKRTPQADTERYAHWENNIICSNCGCSIPTDGIFDFIDKTEVKYCYHCGCKMDGIIK